MVHKRNLSLSIFLGVDIGQIQTIKVRTFKFFLFFEIVLTLGNTLLVLVSLWKAYKSLKEWTVKSLVDKFLIILFLLYSYIFLFYRYAKS